MILILLYFLGAYFRPPFPICNSEALEESTLVGRDLPSARFVSKNQFSINFQPTTINSSNEIYFATSVQIYKPQILLFQTEYLIF